MELTGYWNTNRTFYEVETTRSKNRYCPDPFPGRLLAKLGMAWLLALLFVPCRGLLGDHIYGPPIVIT